MKAEKWKADNIKGSPIKVKMKSRAKNTIIAQMLWKKSEELTGIKLSLN
ncbi:MAG: hypothetical protein M0P71_17490 [Melioribacteraceae bacterium]|nr:hypothetical protein [Melioribacteraceae bacterium]